MDREKKINISVPIFVVCISLTILFYFFMYNNEVRTGASFLDRLTNNNVIVYAAGLFIFVFFFFLLEILFEKNNLSHARFANYSWKVSMLWGWLLSFAVAGFGLYLFIHWGIVDQWNEVGISNGSYDDFPMWFSVFITLLSAFVVFINIIQKRDISRGVLYAIYLFSICITVMQLYINPFSSFYSTSKEFTIGIEGNTSVTETIYNVYDGIPYSCETSSLYGHYGLFFLLPLKLLGRLNPENVIGLLAAIGVIAQIATIYIIDCFAPHKWIAGLLCLAAVIRTTYYYPAISPIRTLWILFIGAYIVYIVRNGYNQKRKIIGFLLCVLSIVWNTETGIACVFGFSVFVYFVRCRKNEKERNLAKRWNIVLSIIYLVIDIAVSLLLAIGIVNVYNFFCGEKKLLFIDFFFPYTENSFMNGMIKCNPPAGNHAWVYIIVLLLGTIAWGLHNELFGSKKTKQEERDLSLCAMSLACISIISFAYYMNEAHWGCMEIVHQICFGLIAVFLKQSYSLLQKRDIHIGACLTRGIVILSIAISLTLSVNSYNDPIRIAARKSSGAYSFRQFHLDANRLAEEIPENTFGIGQGISMIYHTIGWNNHTKCIDTSALNIYDGEEVYNNVIRKVIENDAFLIADSFYDARILETIRQIDPSYELKKEVIVNGCKLFYYERPIFLM